MTYIVERIEPHPEAPESAGHYRVVLRPIGMAEQVGASELTLNVYGAYWEQLTAGQPLVDVIVRRHE